MYLIALAIALPVAMFIDRCWGEPPMRLHPVVWMGNYLGWAGRWLQRYTVQMPEDATVPLGPDLKAFWLGALVWIAGVAMVLVASWRLQAYCLTLPWWAAGLLLGLLLKPLLAWAMLKTEVQAVEAALVESLPAGRERLRYLVSRDVTQLSDTEVRESAIETLAENLNDSVVAPIFWFVLLGLPGAALYRFANTADAMWGYPGIYQGRNWAWAGKWAARADDVLNYVPARLTAALLLLVAGMRGLALVPQLCTEAHKTPSPNSGWPMSAMALTLGIALRKPGVYVLNPLGRLVQTSDTDFSIAFASKVLIVHVFIAFLAIILIVNKDLI